MKQRIRNLRDLKREQQKIQGELRLIEDHMGEKFVALQEDARDEVRQRFTIGNILTALAPPLAKLLIGEKKSNKTPKDFINTFWKEVKLRATARVSEFFS